MSAGYHSTHRLIPALGENEALADLSFLRPMSGRWPRGERVVRHDRVSAPRSRSERESGVSL